VTNKKRAGFYFKVSTAKCISLLVQWLCCRRFFAKARQKPVGATLSFIHIFQRNCPIDQIQRIWFKGNRTGYTQTSLFSSRRIMKYSAIKTRGWPKQKWCGRPTLHLKIKMFSASLCPTDQLQSFTGLALIVWPGQMSGIWHQHFYWPHDTQKYPFACVCFLGWEEMGETFQIRRGWSLSHPKRAGKVKGIIMSLHIYCTRLYLLIIAVNGFSFDLGLDIPFKHCINTFGPKWKVKVFGLLPFLASVFKVIEYFNLIGVEMITDISNQGDVGR